MNRVFCCNYISELDELLKEGAVEVDYVKFPSINTDRNALKRALEIRPVILHGFVPMDGNLGDNNFINSFDLVSFGNDLKLTITPYISGHITATTDHYPDYTSDNEQKYKEIILNNTINNIKFLKQNFSLPLAVENTIYTPEMNILKCVTDTDFICKTVYDTDSYFLFDTSHARVSAYYRNMNFDEYFSKLPMDRIYEVHLSGTIESDDENLLAPHTKMNEEDYNLLEYLLKHTSVKVITLEYGPLDEATYDFVNPRIKQELYEQIIKVQAIMKRYN